MLHVANEYAVKTKQLTHDLGTPLVYNNNLAKQWILGTNLFSNSTFRGREDNSSNIYSMHWNQHINIYQAALSKLNEYIMGISKPHLKKLCCATKKFNFQIFQYGEN